MSRTLPTLLLLSSLALSPTMAQESSAAARDKTPTVRRATVVPKPTPAPKKPSFFQRLFGRRPTPPPATPAPTPAPKVRKSRTTKPSRPISKPASDTAAAKPSTTREKPTAAKVPDATPDKPATAATKPEPTATEPKPPVRKTSTKPAPTSAKSKSPTAPPPDGSDPEAAEKHKYEAAKTKALEDPEIQALKTKADEAVSDDDASKAQRAYNRALFTKMRKLEPGLKDRIDRLEAAVMKRLGDK